jgi:hypothetical protein
MTGTSRFPEHAHFTGRHLPKSTAGLKSLLGLGAGRWSVSKLIVYSLRCKNGHEFEGWFRDSASYDAQSGEGALCCPTCNSRRVEKAIMAPAISASRSVQKAHTEARSNRQFMTGLRKYVQENAEYVGPNFAEEARKIHYGETSDRNIYGETTAEEAQLLVEEGVDVAPLPPDIDAN